MNFRRVPLFAKLNIFPSERYVFNSPHVQVKSIANDRLYMYACAYIDDTLYSIFFRKGQRKRKVYTYVRKGEKKKKRSKNSITNNKDRIICHVSRRYIARYSNSNASN